jgi:colanic acid/amylovoran biosynthesis glycosyltransferase
MREAKAPGDTLQIICVGSLRDYKGQTYLVDACAILRDKNIAFQCSFVGDGDDRADLEAQISRLNKSHA